MKKPQPSKDPSGGPFRKDESDVLALDQLKRQFMPAPDREQDRERKDEKGKKQH